MLDQELLDILACPACKTKVTLVKESWLVCENCGRKYPIDADDIPHMLIEIGDKYRDIPVEKLEKPN
ncbi:MAG: Trm112 family protein [Chloroflexi bacterium]|nr:Trm112 family protein [Chloroflexota bacterium]